MGYNILEYIYSNKDNEDKSLNLKQINKQINPIKQQVNNSITLYINRKGVYIT